MSNSAADETTNHIQFESFVNDKKTVWSHEILNKYYYKGKNCICYIEKKNSHGTGFFCKIDLSELNLKLECLITNYHVLDKDYLKTENHIKLLIKDKSEEKIIKLKNKNRRIFFDDKIDYACIELLEEDNIYDFFIVDPRIYNKNYRHKIFEKETIVISGFPGKTNLITDDGIINSIEKSGIFYHTANTNPGSSGAPIILISNLFLIGIHKGFSEPEQKNVGIFFKYIINNIRDQFVENIVKNQAIINNKIGYFCKLKNINCFFLLTNYDTFKDLFLQKNKILKYETVSGENKIINIKERFFYINDLLDFGILEILEKDNIDINNFFIIEDYIYEKKVKEAQSLLSDKKKDLLSIEVINIDKNQFFKSIKNLGHNSKSLFSLSKLEIEKDKRKSYEAVINSKINIEKFVKEAITNINYFFKYKKYIPFINIRKILINLFVFILLIIPHFKRFYIQHNLSQYFTFQYKANIELYNNNILIIKKGSFNSINYKERNKIELIRIQNGSKLIGDCNSLFQNFSNIKYIEFGNLDTSKVINMNSFFQGCSNLEEIDLSFFNTEKVKSMDKMFYNCKKLKNINLSNFNTENVESMDSMFRGCSSLKDLNISSFNTSNVKYFGHMFESCESLKELNLSHFDTSKVQMMNSMFSSCYSLKKIDLSNFNTPMLKTIQYMFNNSYSLQYLDLSSFNTSLVWDMSCAFKNCTSLKSLNISSFNTSKVLFMREMFCDCYKLEKIYVSNFNVSRAKIMSKMFYGLKSLTSLNLKNFETNSASSMQFMFAQCISLKYLDISNFKVNRNANISFIFYNTSSSLKIVTNPNNIKLLKEFNASKTFY